MKSRPFTSLICAKDSISGLKAILATDRQDFHQPAVYTGRTWPHAYNHPPARSFAICMEPHSGQMSQFISTGFEGIVLFTVTSSGNWPLLAWHIKAKRFLNSVYKAVFTLSDNIRFRSRVFNFAKFSQHSSAYFVQNLSHCWLHITWITATIRYFDLSWFLHSQAVPG